MIEDEPVRVESDESPAVDPSRRTDAAAAAPATVEWCGIAVAPGDEAATTLVVGETYSGATVRIPMHVRRGVEPGPTVFVTGAVHGDEINGTGVIRKIIRDTPFEVMAGTLVLVPVVNLFGYERNSRYLPDRRDLNRSFPGTREGSLASRLAHSFFSQIIRRCDYCIDLHTAAVRRTNFPNVRADMTRPDVAEFARAFGAELVVSGEGPEGSLRSEACKAGCVTIILEAGEVWKVEPTVLEYAVRGITNCLRSLGMVEGKASLPAYRIETDATKWVRAADGGFLEFHVAPGDIVEEGDPIATNTDLMGVEQNLIRAPRDGVVLGMTTIPSVSPGDPVCNLAFPRQRKLKEAMIAVENLDDGSLHERLRTQLASNITVTESEDSSG